MRLGIIAASFFVLQACSVNMALHGKEEPDLGVLRVGASRAEVVAVLGPPVQAATAENGEVDTFEYVEGDQPSAIRAVGHGVADAMTFGLWEVVGTPMEEGKGTKHRVAVWFGADDKVTKFKFSSGATNPQK